MINTFDKLVSYLPRFENEPCEEKTDKWWPSYTKYVEEFFNLVRNEFDDKHYALNDPDVLKRWLEDDSYIGQASPKQCRTLMTYIMCGEKFCDGWWRERIKTGRVQAILRRLSELSSQTDSLYEPNGYKHGPINCRLCFEGTASETMEIDDWRLKNNPGYYGSENPEVLVLGFSKGATQNKAKETQDFEKIAFAGMRHRLQEVLEVLDIMPTNRDIASLFTKDEKKFGFASLVRCSLYKMVKGKALTSGPVVTSAFKELAPRTSIIRCTSQHLAPLPKTLKLIILLGMSKEYIRQTKEIFAKLQEDYRDVNDVSFKAGGAIWVFVAHPSPANGHFRSWIDGNRTTSYHIRRQAQKAVKLYKLTRNQTF